MSLIGTQNSNRLDIVAASCVLSGEIANFLKQIPTPIVLAAEEGRRIIWRNTAATASGFSAFLSADTMHLRFLDKGADAEFADFLEQARTGYCVHNGLMILEGAAVAFQVYGLGRLRAPGAEAGEVGLLLVWSGIQGTPIERGEVRLTPVEWQLATSIVAGRTVRESAFGMGISYHTARKYLQTVFAKLGVRRQTELVARLAHSGVLSWAGSERTLPAPGRSDDR